MHGFAMVDHIEGRCFPVGRGGNQVPSSPHVVHKTGMEGRLEEGGSPMLLPLHFSFSFLTSFPIKPDNALHFGILKNHFFFFCPPTCHGTNVHPSVTLGHVGLVGYFYF